MSLYLDIEKDLGGFQLKVQLEAGSGATALLGPSGCGKSMTLKCIAGIERPDRGRIVVDDRVLFDSEEGIDLTPQERHTGLLFQNYGLFPNMTVLQNIRTGARREKDRDRRSRLIREMMESFGIAELANRYPSQLSGGQQQRTALARILVSDPHILMLDEPFSALDSHLRFRLEQEVREVIRSFGRTVLLVSHDRDEVFRLSEKIAVMNRGRVETYGTRDQVFAEPATRAGAMLTGCKNISAIEKLDEHHFRALDWGLTLETDKKLDGAVYAGIRMHDVQPGPGVNSCVCRVIEIIENPFSYTVMLRPAEQEKAVPIGWEMNKESWNSLRADTIEIHLPPEAVVLLRG